MLGNLWNSFVNWILKKITIAIIPHLPPPRPLPNFKVYFLEEPTIGKITYKVVCHPPQSNRVVKRIADVQCGSVASQIEVKLNEFTFTTKQDVDVHIKIQDFNASDIPSEWSPLVYFQAKDIYAPPKPGNLTAELVSEIP